MLAIWVPFTDRKDLLPVLDILLDQTSEMVERSVIDLLEATLGVLQASRGELGIMEALSSRLPRLLSAEHSSEAVQSTVAAIITFTLPLSHNGRELEPGARLDLMVKEAGLRWVHRSDHLPEELHISKLLSTPSWSDSIVQILSAMLYRSASARHAFREWIDTEGASGQETRAVIMVLDTYLDSSSSDTFPNNPPWAKLFDRLLEFFFEGENDKGLQTMCGRCILTMLQSSADPMNLLPRLERRVDSLPVGIMDADLVLLGMRLHRVIRSNAEGVVTAIIDLGLQWAVRSLSDDVLNKPKVHPILNQLCMYLSKLSW